MKRIPLKTLRSRAFCLFAVTISSAPVSWALETSTHVSEAPGGGYLVTGHFNQISFPQSLCIVKIRENGTIDNSFGTRGRAGYDFLTTQMQAGPHSYDQQGRIYLPGVGTLDATSGVTGPPFSFLVRLNSDGRLDRDFADEGVFRYSGDQGVLLVKPQLDGKILVVASRSFLRLLEDGSLDTSFGTDGEKPIMGMNGYDRALPLLDGRILISGKFNGIALFSPEGVHDPSFGSPVGSLFRFGDRKLAQQPDGKIIVADSVGSGNSFEVRFCRLALDGTLDTSFGTNGYYVPQRKLTPVDLSVSSSGTIELVASIEYTISRSFLCLFQIDENGVSDIPHGAIDAFGKRLDLDATPPSLDTIVGVLPLSDGRRLIHCLSAPSLNAEKCLTRLLSNGEPDLQFGDRGVCRFGFAFGKPLLSRSPINRAGGEAGEFRVPVLATLKSVRVKSGRPQQLLIYAAECGLGSKTARYSLERDRKDPTLIRALHFRGSNNTFVYPPENFDKSGNLGVRDFVPYATGRIVMRIRPDRRGAGTFDSRFIFRTLADSASFSLRFQVSYPR